MILPGLLHHGSRRREGRPLRRGCGVRNGIITTVAGNGTAGFSGDGGPATAASLGIPYLAAYGVAVDSSGNLFIAELSYVSPTQINLQAPDDTAAGSVPVVVTTAGGTTAGTVTLAQLAPSFLLLDGKHVAGIIVRLDGSGAYGGGTYDLIGPTGTSLGYPTVAAKAGDSIALYAVGLGPTTPAVPAGQAFSGAAPTTNPVTVLIGGASVTPFFAGMSGAGLYQINLTVPVGLGTGEVSLTAAVGGARTPANVVISLATPLH